MKKIALVIKSDKDEGVSFALKTIQILLACNCTLYLKTEERNVLGEFDGVVYREEGQIFDDAECVIVLGGDGTIMRTAHKTRLPILGINLGRIGYIAELETNELNLLSELVNDNFTIENRMMLSYRVMKNGESMGLDASVLNEVVLSKGGHSVMPEIELICNGEEVGKYFADGLICATPTGSTAYSLSAGGSIVDPGMECFCITQVCPQSFYAKPLIFSGESALTFKKGKRGHGRVHLVADGDFITEIEENDTVTVKKSDISTKLIKIKKNNFYSVMRSKMTEI
ncbi:MAG: NAD(+)/NADH kinase [Ruminococcaceae bacterium]|nr:NAD(+)/NADH kinase [Oscillospiraceae bacterium]